MQKKTDRFPGDLDFTMLLQMSRRGKLEVALCDDTDLRPLGQILEPPIVNVDAPTQRMSSIEETKYLKGSSIPQQKDYNLLLLYLNKAGVIYHSAYTSRIEPDMTYLRPSMQTHNEVHIGDRTYSTRSLHVGNSAIQFFEPVTALKNTGFIERILSTPLKLKVRTFFVVQCHRRLDPDQEQKAPFHRFNKKFNTRIYDSAESNQFVIVEAQHIVSHLSTFRRPAGTYGIPRETLVVCWSLNRNRRCVT